jgi:hypothetical protein
MYIQRDILNRANKRLKLALTVFLVIFFTITGCSNRAEEIAKQTDRINELIISTIELFKITDSYLYQEIYKKKQKGDLEYKHIQKTFKIDDRYINNKKLQETLDNKLAEINVQLEESRFTYKKNYQIASFNISFDGLNVYNLKIESLSEKRTGPKIALVLDDWGYSIRNLDSLWQLDIPVTIAILPNLAYSDTIAEEAKRRGQQVILHLPMESHHSKAVEKKVITTDMTSEQIVDTFNDSLSSVRYAVGISNHMGSKATEDKRVLKILFKQLKAKDLFFLDSLVTSKSKVSEVAEEVGIDHAQRSIFIDNKSNFEYIKKQMNKLVEIAIAKGEAVGIGHDKKNTLEALNKIIPELKNKDVQFIFLSELINVNTGI